MRQEGMSIVIVLVALGVMGILGVIVAEVFENNLIASKIVNNKAIVEDLEQYFKIAVDCNKTLAANLASCATGTPLTIKRKDNSDLVQKPTVIDAITTYSTIGKFKLKASCLDIVVNPNPPNGYTIKVEFFPNNKKRWQAIFNKLPLGC